MTEKGRPKDIDQGTLSGHMGDSAADNARAAFTGVLRRALIHLYDPGMLLRSSLLQLLHIGERADPQSALRDALAAAVEALKPDSDVSPDSNAWRIYNILRYRYLEQSPQSEVASDLGLSIRHLRRQEKAALEVLSDYLWSRYGLADQVRTLDAQAPEKWTPSREQELKWLESSTTGEPTDLTETIRVATQTVQPMLKELGVSVVCDTHDTISVTVNAPAIRQVVLYLLTMAMRRVPWGQIEISISLLPRRAYARLRVIAQCGGSLPRDIDDAEDFEMVRRLVRISGGYLEARREPHGISPFEASVLLPTTEDVPVLIVDDNVDTLRLMKRYLSHSRYRFVGTSRPADALPLAEQVSPAIIVLDVMLPEVDGWELIGRLREFPGMEEVPIIVCTILSQQQLALTLGAAEFLRKPVSQEALIAALDRHVAPWLRGSPPPC